MTTTGWRFPPTGGGMESGINDAGIVTFDGAPLDSLAREVLQNSVDERMDPHKPVHVTFEIRAVTMSEISGQDLATHLDDCIDDWEDDEKAHSALKEARARLDGQSLTLLGIIDENTSGLVGDKWRGLVKLNGASFKQSDSAGGSFGVGKAAPFVVSPLRTVFYWSCFLEDGQAVEQLQGKAVLVSHQHNFGDGPETTQNTGFFGANDARSCEPISELIPPTFRHVNRSGQPVQGTAIWVAGFEPDRHGEEWQQAITRSIVEFFFHAIECQDLEVILEPDPEAHDKDDDWVISKATLPSLFEKLAPRPEGESEIDEQIERSRLYWELMTSRDPIAVMDKEQSGLKNVKLWIATEEDFPERQLPNTVALIRGTGMLITDEQKRNWKGFRNLRDYVAVCLIEDEESNALLRRMENPAHDQFEPDRIRREDERQRAVRALEGLRDWIRQEVGKVASPPKVEVTEDVNELLDYLYAEDSGPFSDSAPGAPQERKFGEAGEIRRKPPRRRVRPTVLTDDDDSDLSEGEGAEGTDVGEHGGGGGDNGGDGGNGYGPNEGNGKGGSGTKGGGKGRKPISLTNVRVIHDEGNPLRSRVLFTSNETAVARLEVSEAGDYSAIPRDDVTLYDETGGLVDDSTELHIIAGTRYEFELIGLSPLDETAWQVVASGG